MKFIHPERENLDNAQIRETEKEQITVDLLEKVSQRCYDLKADKALIEKEKTKKHVELTDMQETLGVLMDKLEISSYKSKSGTVSKREESNYRLPQDDASRAAFFAYLKNREVFDTMITINAKTLNSFVKQEIEIKELDEEFGFLPAGIEETSQRTVFSLKK